MSASQDPQIEKAQLWLNMALATGVAACLLASVLPLIILAAVANAKGWQTARSVQVGSGKVVAGTALTAVGLFNYTTGSTLW